MKRQDALFKGTLESPVMLCTVVPIAVYNSKSDAFIWWPRVKANDTSIFFSRWSRRLTLLASSLSFNSIRRSLGLVDEIRVEDVEFVALNDLWWRVVMIVVGLVVLVPFVAHLDSIKILRLSWTILAHPQV